MHSLPADFDGSSHAGDGRPRGHPPHPQTRMRYRPGLAVEVAVHIIALTASAMQGDREQCLAAGMNDYVIKPVRRGESQAALERWNAAAPHTLAGTDCRCRGTPIDRTFRPNNSPLTPRPLRASNVAWNVATVRRKNRGFTLVEIMIVVLIIAILAMIGRAAIARINLRAGASVYENDCPVSRDRTGRGRSEPASRALTVAARLPCLRAAASYDGRAGAGCADRYPAARACFTRAGVIGNSRRRAPQAS